MHKLDVLSTLRKQKVVVVVRGDTQEEGINTAIACIEGGIKSIEVAYTNSNASSIIKDLTKQYKQDIDVCIGAGTVLDAPTAKDAIMAGAQYIVSPSFNLETAILCNRYAIPYIPGCMTITEIVTAMESGSKVIKLFPGSAFSPKYISAIKSPLPHVSIMVTGGVSLDNAKEWFDAGVEVIGIGGELNTLAKKGDFEKITDYARMYASL
ncbi:bifunctional 2-keto-4-hydroxyglutarate aldolase/2-keto-3-deoxy-6-phosphogluconate aldolase [Tannockella kyphosi]|uniref:bifunctional 2-keto-4-hydroxyglutarate aldolase/2-keto-3-deoxy-6-phosphogluconate aldolase n=1 Tax=Tannockella kyphosi TaxID=2899121 RepID=UPI00201355FB|nr:bifunctional 2-keto-4-hydroxyglutarate aldolase/2-keto-3-deoxy-6-phosphogluconate aldolase [Tannockella kyphosi]